MNLIKIYTNVIVINSVKYTNIIEAENYTEALKLQKERKVKSKNVFIGRLQFAQIK